MPLLPGAQGPTATTQLQTLIFSSSQVTAALLLGELAAESLHGGLHGRQLGLGAGHPLPSKSLCSK